ncbi:hypothetical protein [Ekhidna sp.]|uniref:hypothetical protein n=1 Tax=Ekhidna sp. TaxID=2608089 RepID=UPI003B500BEC
MKTVLYTVAVWRPAQNVDVGLSSKKYIDTMNKFNSYIKKVLGGLAVVLLYLTMIPADASIPKKKYLRIGEDGIYDCYCNEDGHKCTCGMQIQEVR